MKYHVIVVRPEDGSVLALPSSDGWAVPEFIPTTTDARIVDHINTEMHRQLGFETWTLKCAARGEDGEEPWRIFIAVARNADVSAPPGTRWVEQRDISSILFNRPATGNAIAAWLEATASPTALRAPWEYVGWHDAACDWIQAHLTALGMIATAPPVQQRAWGLSCTMKVGTDHGDVYFKATPQFMSHEGRAMQAIAERCPQLLPAPLAVDSGNGWLLMPDFGSDMLHECPDISRWEDALRTIAAAQVEQVESLPNWLSLNIPDRRLGRMVEMIDPLIASCSRMLKGGSNGLSESEVEDLRSLSMPLKLMCARLAQYGVPHTLVHGDLGGNIIIRDGGYTFFDWTDVCISHPFFEMATISAAYFDESVLKDCPDADARLRNAYLEPWNAFQPTDVLVEAFEATRALGALHQTMTYMWILTNISMDARPELEGGLLHWVRQLLRLCGRSSDSSAGDAR